MLLRVKRIRDYGVFASFDWADELTDFSRRNLIYGWNYSGKTTLSRIIRSIGLGTSHPDFADGQFVVEMSDGVRITSPGEPAPFPIQVFNSDYVDENLHWEEGVDPILVLGKTSRALEERRQRLRALVDRLDRRKDSLENTKASISEGINSAATRAAAEVRRTLGETPFNRSPHLEGVVAMVGEEPTKYLLTDAEYHQQFSIYRAEQRETIKSIPDVKERVDQEAVDALLLSTAQQEVIERLKADCRLEEWVEEGLSLHEDGDTCKFCGGALPRGLLDRLSLHFSDAVRTLRDEIGVARDDLQNCRVSPGLFDAAKLYEDLRTEYLKLSAHLCRAADRINTWIASALSELEDKKSRVDESYGLRTGLNHRAYTLIDACTVGINNLVETHNARVADSAGAKRDAKLCLIRHNAAAYVTDTDLGGRRRHLESLDERLETDSRRRGQLADALGQVEEQISEEIRGADRINDYLRFFFGGKEEIQIGVRPDNKYTLRRSGRNATNLSEGERTAISFSYFLAQLSGADARLEDSVVYVDDPVSSLDSNHIYNTYAVIRDVLAKARQLFVSTHDYAFFKLLRGDGAFKEFPEAGTRRASLYYIRRGPSGARLERLPEVLRRYNSEYHHLFSLMYGFHCDPECDSGLLLLLPNIVRRVLETYTSFRVPKTSMTLDQRLERLCADEMVAHRIYKFVNQQSHSDSLSGADEFPHVEECSEVIDLVIEMMKMDSTHCNGMIDLCELHPLDS